MTATERRRRARMLSIRNARKMIRRKSLVILADDDESTESILGRIACARAGAGRNARVIIKWRHP